MLGTRPSPRNSLSAALLTGRPNSLSASLTRTQSTFHLKSYSFSPENRTPNGSLGNKQGGICFFLPSVLGFFMSSTLISFFLTLRVEFTSLCNLLNFTDSSVSSSDCSLDWQRNKGNVNQRPAPELCSCSRVHAAWPACQSEMRLLPSWTWGTNQCAQQAHEAPPTISRSMSGELGPKQHSTHPRPWRAWGAFMSTTSRSSFRRTPQDPLRGWPCNSSFAAVVWARLSSVWPIRTCCLNVVTNYFSKPKFCWLVPVLPPNQKQQGRKKEEMQKAAFCLTGEDRLPHRSHVFRLSQLLPRAQKASVRTAPTFLREGQGKKLTFSAIQHSPYSPASHFILQWFKYAQPSCFPSSIQHYRE